MRRDAQQAADAPLVFIRRALASRTRSAPTCPSPDEAPLRTGASPDAFACVRLGASPDVLASDWPDASALPAPVRYIRSGIAPGGDGTPDRPFSSLAEARASAPPRTLVFSRGDHPLAPSLALPAELTLVGAGASVTTLTLSPDGAGLVVRASARFSATSLTLRHPGDSPAPEASILLDATGASVTLRDVALDHGHDALRLTGETLSATRLTVRRRAAASISSPTPAPPSTTSSSATAPAEPPASRPRTSSSPERSSPPTPATAWCSWATPTSPTAAPPASAQLPPPGRATASTAS
ncbi:MAG: hypothetical protein IPN17_37230 [Deltaproteobacteria bacterium]|nr:hypothetical protein [Deltaproteobacteria bacterium]